MKTPVEIAVPLGILSFLVILENAIVLYLVIRNRHMRTYTNGFVVSLAMSDTMTGLVIFCQYLIGFSNAVVINIVYAIVLLGGAANITAVTLDRYLAITKPFKYVGIMSKYFKFIVMVTWLTSITTAILPLCWYGNITMRYHKIYIFATLGLGVLAPYIFILFANIKIYSIVRRSVRKEKRTYSGVSQDKGRRSRTQIKIIISEAKVARVFALTAVAFAVSWFPVLYYTIAAAVGNFDVVPEIVITLSPFFIVIGSLTNPIIYSFMKPDFKIAVRYLLSKAKLTSFGKDICVVYSAKKRSSEKSKSEKSVIMMIVAGTAIETSCNFTANESEVL